MWGGLERKIEAHFLDMLAQGLSSKKHAVDIPGVGKAHWDGASGAFHVTMTTDFRKKLTSPDKR